MKITNKRFPLFTLLLIFMGAQLSAAPSRVIDLLADNTGHVDGLDNPRQIKLSSDNALLYVVSSDDNSFAIFGSNQDLSLTFQQVFKDTNTQDLPLEGASDLVTLGNGKKILVVSFYDGAISMFNRNHDGQYVFSKTISDKLSYQRVFKDSEPLEGLDKHGLLGAWSLIKSSDEKQILVASYQSNAISVFDVSANMDILFSHAIRSTNIDLGKPVSLALSPSSSELFVVGYEKHRLTIFDRKTSGELAVKQIIDMNSKQINQCLNPQKIVVSASGEFLYLACAGSNSIAVFERVDQQYALVQTISNSAIGGSGLTGVGSLALSHDGNSLYTGAEGDSGLLIFGIKASGELNLKRRLTFKEHGIRAVSSIALTNDGKYLLTTLAKDDTLMTIKLP